MKLRLSVLTMALIFMVSLSLEAQDSRVERRAKNRANQNVDREVDKAVDKTFNKIGGLFKKKKKKQEEQPLPEGEDMDPNQVPEGMIDMGSDEPWEPIRNEEIMSFVMDMTIEKKNGKKEEHSITMVYDEWQIGMASETEDGKGRFILDNQDGTITTITQGEGEHPQGIKMRQPNLRKMVSDAVGEYSVMKTGNTKVIDGYQTEEYEIEHEDGITNVWVTQDVKANYQGMMQVWQKQNQSQQGPYMGDVKGFPIESVTVSKNGKETIYAHYRDIKTGDDIDRSIFDLTGVKIMKMGM